MPYYIELPADDDGNLALPPAVFEGRIIQGGSEPGHFSNPGRKALVITGPPEIACKHTGMYTDSYGGFAEVPGPARLLARNEYDSLLRTVRRG